MKVIVTASRRDEIIQRRDEYDNKRARNKQIQDEQDSRFQEAQYAVYSQVETAIRNELGELADGLTIRVRDAIRRDMLEVSIRNGPGITTRHESSASLSWSWEATLDRSSGELRKESSSWSGLQATTLEQISDLRRCVDQLEAINLMDWNSILDVQTPNWEDYHDRSQIEDIGARPNFELELMEAELEDAIGANVLIPVCLSGHDCYAQILKDSGSQYTIREVSQYDVKAILENKSRLNVTSIKDLVERYGYTHRIRKDTFFKSAYTQSFRGDKQNIEF